MSKKKKIDVKCPECERFMSLNVQIINQTQHRVIGCMCGTSYMIRLDWKPDIMFSPVKWNRYEYFDRMQARRAQLLKKISESNLSIRLANTLRLAGKEFWGDVCKEKRPEDMLKYKNFGRKTFVELEDVLKEMDLEFGMDVEEITRGEIQTVEKV